MLIVSVEIDGVQERFVDDNGHFVRALRHVDPADGGLLQWWDPYGDVFYNDRQSLVVVAEIEDLLLVCPDETHAALREVLSLAELAGGRRGRQLWLAGD